MLKISQYPLNADRTPMDLLVGVLTDATGNGGARLTTPPVGPDNAPIDTKALILVDQTGAPVNVAGGSSVVMPQAFATSSGLGPLGTGIQNDYAAFAAARDYLKSIAVNNINNVFKSSPMLFIPAGHYYMGGQALEFTHTLIIYGEGGIGIGASGGAATKLRWDAGCDGFVFQSEHTSGSGANNTYDAVAHFTSANSCVKDVYLCGPAAASNSLSAVGLTEGEFCAVRAKANIVMEGVFAEGWQGDGVRAYTTTGAGDATEGYFSGSRFYNCWMRACRAGWYIRGADANVCSFIGCQATFNRACGVDEQSFLGNSHIAWHTNGNGVYLDNQGTANFPAYVVTAASKRFCPVQGQEAAASVTDPSALTADSAVWLYLGAGAGGTGIPAWTNGMSLRCAAPIRTNNNNAQNLIYNFYSETGQGFSQLVHPTMVQGGLHGQGAPKGDHVYIRNGLGAFEVDKLQVDSTATFYNSVTMLNQLLFEGAGFLYNGKISTNDTFRWLAIDGQNYIVHTIAGVSIVNVESTGLNLQPGKILAVNGTQVVGARQTGTPADATDLASALTLVNALKAKLIAHGLIS